MIDFGCVSPRILWAKQILRVKVCMVAVYGPLRGKLRKERGFGMT